MADIEIVSEREEAAGWRFEAAVHTASGGSPRHYVLTLAWADYNLWSASGSDEPAAVARAVVQFMIDRSGSEGLKPKFDAAVTRRLHPDADAVIPGMISGGGGWCG